MLEAAREEAQLAAELLDTMLKLHVEVAMATEDVHRRDDEDWFMEEEVPNTTEDAKI